MYIYTGYLITLRLTLVSLNPTLTAATEPGFSAAAEVGGGPRGGGKLAETAATRDVQVSGASGNGGRGDGAGAEAAGGSYGGQNAGEEGGINSDQKTVMAGAGSAAVAKHSVWEGEGREGVVTAANQGQIASDTAGSGVKCCLACRCTIRLRLRLRLRLRGGLSCLPIYTL